MKVRTLISSCPQEIAEDFSEHLGLHQNKKDLRLKGLFDLLYEYHSELSTEDIKHQIPSYQDSKVLLRKDLHDLKDRLINFLGIKQLEKESFCQIRMNHDALKT
ncbi:MAG: hypothetical protein AAFR14_12035, partial [Bacteroidota bacterium]